MTSMISVVIPALNEENTIAEVVIFCKKNVLVNEVIVVDDKSEDSTASVALNAGAKVITSEIRGKGTSMKDGLNAAANEWIIFIDGDIGDYPEKQ